MYAANESEVTGNHWLTYEITKSIPKLVSNVLYICSYNSVILFVYMNAFYILYILIFYIVTNLQTYTNYMNIYIIHY